MKFILLFFLTLPAYSNVIKYKNTGPGFVPEATLTTGSISTLKRNINFLDQNNLSLGTYELSSDPNSAIKKLLTVEEQLKETENFLKQKKKSLKVMESGHLHGPHYLFGKLKIVPGSQMYADSDEAFKNVLRLDWKLVDGVRLDPKKQKLQFVQKGEVVREIPFFKKGLCKEEKPYLQCMIKGYGILSITI